MSDSFETLKNELLDLIAEAVNMKNLERSTLHAHTPLMAQGLGLDSIDILEVVIALEKKYVIKIANDDNSRKIFTNLGSLADFIAAKKTSQVEIQL